MSDMQEFMKIVRACNEKWGKPPTTKAEELKKRIFKSEKTNEDWLELKKDVLVFYQSDAPEEEKEMLSKYTETLNMVCSAIEEGIF